MINGFNVQSSRFGLHILSDKAIVELMEAPVDNRECRGCDTNLQYRIDNCSEGYCPRVQTENPGRMAD